MTLRKKTISGLFWSAFSQGGKQVTQFIITAILARLLLPSDFGLIAMATVFTGFAMILSEMGISSALIQRQELRQEHFSSVFWLNVGVGFLLTVIFILLAPFVASFYKKPELTLVLRVLAFNFIFSSLTIVQQALLTKDMNFRSLMVRDIVAVIVSGFVGIYLAMHGAGVWSLIIQTLVFTLVNGVLLWFLSSWRPMAIFSLNHIKEIFHFSANVTGFQVINYFGRNLDSLLIGKFMGSQQLGYYSVAYKLMMLPLQNFTWVISKVMFPAFSKIQHDLIKVRENYLRMIRLVALISFPFMTFLYVISGDLIDLVYGHQWAEVVPLVKILCFCGMIQSIGSLGGVIYLATGKANVQFKMVIISTILLTIILTFAVRYNIKTVAMAYTIYYLFWSNLSFLVVSRLISLSMKSLYASILVPFLLSMVLFLSLEIIGKVLILPVIMKLLVLGLVGGGIYISLMLITKQMYFSGKYLLKFRDI